MTYFRIKTTFDLFAYHLLLQLGETGRCLEASIIALKMEDSKIACLRLNAKNRALRTARSVRAKRTAISKTRLTSTHLLVNAF